MDIGTALSRLPDAKKKGGKWRAACPAHGGEDANLEIRDDGGQAFFTCYSHNCDYKDILSALGEEEKRPQLQPVSIMPPMPEPPPMDFESTTAPKTANKNGQAKKKTAVKKTIVAIYPYKNEKGELLYEKIRYEPKTFLQRVMGEDGKYTYSLGKTRRILYNLQAVIKSEMVFIVEGEKDVDRLAELDIVATCNFDGAGKWLEQYNEFFKGKSVYIIPDYDQQGDDHAQLVYKNVKPLAANIKIVDLPGNEEKGADVSDWLDKGNTAEDLLLLAIAPPTIDSVKGIPPIQSGADLYNKYFAPLEFVVADVFALGHLFLLGGRPKSGKSWMMLQLAAAIDMKRPFLGKFTRPSKILYLALEDGERRINQRMKILKWKPDNIDFMFSISPLSTGGEYPGLEQLGKLVEFYDVIIIDTLIATLNGTTNENDNVQMGNVMNGLAELAHDNNTAIGLVHHTGKGIKDDPFNSFRGASSIRGAYDVGAILMREVGASEAILHLESRDFEIEDMTINQNPDGAGWEALGNGGVIKDIKVGKRVMQIINQHGDGFNAAEYAELAEVSVQAARSALKTAASRNLVIGRMVKPEHGGRAIEHFYEV